MFYVRRRDEESQTEYGDVTLRAGNSECAAMLGLLWVHVHDGAALAAWMDILASDYRQ